ncbi:MAG: OmpH family outer membrane protein [Acidobacteria bacterium]|nr:OmpH family outer membrane protein [Acidobacteriota bacterium]
MKAIRWTRLAIVAAVALCTAAGVQAQVKIGAVNLQKALQDTAEIKLAEADLKARFGPRQDELAQLERETAKLQQEYDTNQGKYTEAALAELGARLQLKQRQLQRNSEALQEAVNRDRQDILQRVGQRLQEVVKKVAEEKGLDMVVDGANLLYSKPAFDISADVTAAYDKAYPGKK